MQHTKSVIIATAASALIAVSVWSCVQQSHMLSELNMIKTYSERQEAQLAIVNFKMMDLQNHGIPVVDVSR